MVKKKRCSVQFWFFHRELTRCDLDQGHRGKHKTTGCVNVEDQTWELSWGQDQSGLKAEPKNEV